MTHGGISRESIVNVRTTPIAHPPSLTGLINNLTKTPNAGEEELKELKELKPELKLCSNNPSADATDVTMKSQSKKSNVGGNEAGKLQRWECQRERYSFKVRWPAEVSVCTWEIMRRRCLTGYHFC